MSSSFSDRLVEARKAAGLTQSDLVELMDDGTYPTRLSLYENGHSFPHPKRLSRLAEVLGVDKAWLKGCVCTRVDTSPEPAEDPYPLLSPLAVFKSNLPGHPKATKLLAMVHAIEAELVTDPAVLSGGASDA